MVQSNFGKYSAMGGLLRGLGAVTRFLIRPKMVPFTFLAIVFAFIYSMCLEYIRPNEYGIKEVQIGINKGIQKDVYPSGFAFVIPNMQIMHRLPQNVQVLEMVAEQSSKQRSAALLSDDVRHERPAKIQTSDGFYVDVDVSILYRIADPYTVMVKLGPGNAFYEQGLRPKAEPILKEALGELTTEEFYDSPKRMAKSQLAKELLDKEMRQYGIEVDQVLIRYFVYTERIQQNIEAKKLQDQLVMTNEAQKKAATKEQELNRVSQEGEMKVQITIQEGDSYKTMKEAEQELYVRKKQAAADLLVALAEAKRSELKNVAMQEGGVDRKIAMELAEVLEGLNAIVLPATGEGAINPLNLDKVLDMFGVEESDAEETSANVKIESLLPSDFLENARKETANVVGIDESGGAEPPGVAGTTTTTPDTTVEVAQ